MLVVSDASPLNVLVRLGLVHFLPEFYGTVVIPPAVERELSHSNTPKPIRDWLDSKPSWLSVKRPSQVDPGLASGAGEREAISLAVELRADFLLVDDKEARSVARRLKVPITGTIGVLELAAASGRIELRPVLEQFQGMAFFIDDEVIKRAFEREDERRQSHNP